MPNAPFPSRGNVFGVSLPSPWISWISAQLPMVWGAVSQSVSAVMCKTCSVTFAQGKLESSGHKTHTSHRGSFTFQDFTISSLYISLFLPDPAPPSYEALVFNLGNSSPSLSVTFQGKKAHIMRISYSDTHILVHYQDPC